MEVYEMKILETDILELNDNIDQSELSSQALNRYIEISTHYINMDKAKCRHNRKKWDYSRHS